MKKLEYLIFDLDGTLVDSAAGVVEAVNFALKKSGQPLRSEEAIKRFIGCPLNEMFAEFTNVPYPILLEHFRARAAESVVNAAVPLAGVDETLKLLTSDYQMGIATTKASGQVADILTRLGWNERFAAVCGGDEVVTVKPAPDIFLLACDRLGCGSDQAIVVGDTVNDVFGAKAAGLPVIAVPSEFGDPADLVNSKPDYYIEHFSELPSLLFKIQRGRRDAI